MGPKKKDNTGRAFMDRVSSLFDDPITHQEEEPSRSTDDDEEEDE